MKKSVPFFLIALVYTSFCFSQTFTSISTLKGHDGGITVISKDPLNHYLIAGDSKGKLYFYDLQSTKIIRKIDAHLSPIAGLQFNSNGNLLISSTADGEIKIYDFQKEKIIQSIYSPEYSGINFVLFSIADGFIYFNGYNHLFKTRSDLTQHVDEIITEKDSLYDAVITNDRSSLIYSCGNSIKVLNTRSDNLRQEIHFGNSNIVRIALVKDTVLATWSSDGTLAMWHYSLNQISTQPIFSMKAGNPSPMNFSSSGRMMCSGNIGNWARIWIPMEKEVLQELFEHKETVTSSAFGITDDILFTGSLDGSIIQWQRGGVKPPEVEKPNILKTEILDSTPALNKSTIEVHMQENNVPTEIKGRKVTSTDKIEVNNSTLKIYVYDNSYIDGDTMSLFFNGNWIVDHYGVTKKKYEIDLHFIENTNNYLVLFANNLGKSPPNTAAIEFDDGKKRYFYKLSSDLKTCSAINFFYKK